MSVPLRNTPDRSIGQLPPMLILSRPTHADQDTTPRLISIKQVREALDDEAVAASLIPSLLTLRPTSTIKRSSPKTIPLSIQSTIKYLTPLQPHLSSFQQILNRFSPRSPDLPGPGPVDSQATARPQARSPVQRGIEGVKVDELDHEVCYKCRKERETEEMELRRVQSHGLQWMCKGGCEDQTEVSVGKGERAVHDLNKKDKTLDYLPNL